MTHNQGHGKRVRRHARGSVQVAVLCGFPQHLLRAQPEFAITAQIEQCEKMKCPDCPQMPRHAAAFEEAPLSVLATLIEFPVPALAEVCHSIRQTAIAVQERIASALGNRAA